MCGAVTLVTARDLWGKPGEIPEIKLIKTEEPNEPGV